MERAAFILILRGPITISKALRIAGSTILNIVTATLGTAILESAVYNVYHPETLAGLYKKELLLSGTVAFSLGALVYSKWKCRSAEWICILGFAGFIWRILLGDQPPSSMPGHNGPRWCLSRCV